MTLFVDASALVAVIAEDEGFELLEAELADADELLCSPVSIWETVVALCRKLEAEPHAVRERVESFVSTFEFRLVPVAKSEAEFALLAYDRYGKGRHKARLNMGDCFAYACAQANDAKLLYKGDDFARTDLA